MQDFKTKAEIAKALDELGVEYAKVMSGANIGKPIAKFDELLELYKNNVEVKQEAVVFKRPIRKFNSHSFSFKF